MGNVAAFIAKSLERSTVGVPISREAASLQVGRQKSCEAATLLLAEPLRLRHLPYPRSTRGRGGHSYVSQSCNSTSIFARIRRTFIKIRLIYAEEDIATSRQPQQ